MVDGNWGSGKDSIEWLVFSRRGLVDLVLVGAGDSVAPEPQGSVNCLVPSSFRTLARGLLILEETVYRQTVYLSIHPQLARENK